jgi:hypothetical protein
MSPRAARFALTGTLLGIYGTLGIVRTISNFLRDRGLLRGTVVVAFAAAGIAILWLIFRDARNRSVRVMLSLLIAGAAYAAVILPMKSPEEKIHFIEYGGVAVLAYASALRTWRRWKRFAGCALFVGAAGWIDGIQALLPSRFYDLRDVGFNAAAGLMALAMIAIFFPHERAVGTDRSEEMAGDAVHGRAGGDG